MLSDKTIVLGVTGGIAAYKAAELASKLTQAGAKVDVVMTEAATRFVAPLTFQSLTRRPVYTSLWESPEGFDVDHIALAERADIVVIAPATADSIAKMAAGIADDLLTCTVLATMAPVVVAPAMNVKMFTSPITQVNIAKLWDQGFTIIDPTSGYLACGEEGLGRLADIEEIEDTLRQMLGRAGDLAGRCVVVTAGGTQEPIDPVRYITNGSSGKMGYALAVAARDRGAEVVLITGPTSLRAPEGIVVWRVRTAVEMQQEVLQVTPMTDALIMAAAVADYRPASVAEQKIKKQERASDFTLELVRNPDILEELEADFVKVGFAAETEKTVENATSKLKGKGLDLIVANDITDPGSTFGADTSKVVLIDRDASAEELPLLPKSEVAHRILDRVVSKLSSRDG
jgi:phosphopantothenoylcysteine decarboxylase/phosphopantothenate--cysteine ligase